MGGEGRRPLSITILVLLLQSYYAPTLIPIEHPARWTVGVYTVRLSQQLGYFFIKRTFGFCFCVGVDSYDGPCITSVRHFNFFLLGQSLTMQHILTWNV